MISGALFLRPEKQLDIRRLYKKNISRLLICIILFGTLFALMEIVYNNKSFSIKMIYEAFLYALQNKSWGHMWYLYMIVGLYVVSPILKIYINNSSNKDLLYFLFVLIFFNIVLPFFNSIFGIEIAFYIPFNGKYLILYLLGYMIHAGIIKVSRVNTIILMVVGLSYFVFKIIFHSEINSSAVVFTEKYNILFIIDLIPISIFQFFKFNTDLKYNKIINFLSEQSFGVYIFHAVVLNLIYKVFDLPAFLFQKGYLLCMWIGVFFITLLNSVILTYLLRKIGFVRKWIL